MIPLRLNGESMSEMNSRVECPIPQKVNELSIVLVFQLVSEKIALIMMENG